VEDGGEVSSPVVSVGKAVVVQLHPLQGAGEGRGPPSPPGAVQPGIQTGEVPSLLPLVVHQGGRLGGTSCGR